MSANDGGDQVFEPAQDGSESELTPIPEPSATGADHDSEDTSEAGDPGDGDGDGCAPTAPKQVAPALGGQGKRRVLIIKETVHPIDVGYLTPLLDGHAVAGFFKLAEKSLDDCRVFFEEPPGIFDDMIINPEGFFVFKHDCGRVNTLTLAKCVQDFFDDRSEFTVEKISRIVGEDHEKHNPFECGGLFGHTDEDDEKIRSFGLSGCTYDGDKSKSANDTPSRRRNPPDEEMPNEFYRMFSPIQKTGEGLTFRNETADASDKIDAVD